MKKLILFSAMLTCLAGCNNKERQAAAAARVKQAAIDSINHANAQQHKIDSLEALTRMTGSATLTEHQAMIPLSDAPRKTNPKKPARKTNLDPGVVKNPGVRSPGPQATGSGASTVSPSNGGTTATPEKKKGLNNAAKGAIIGLGTGAAAGAIIGKENRGKGAVIGGVVGAIGGAVGGAVLDKRKAKRAAERDSIRRDSIRRSQQ